jgi:hypothetical protein
MVVRVDGVGRQSLSLRRDHDLLGEPGGAGHPRLVHRVADAVLVLESAGQSPDRLSERGDPIVERGRRRGPARCPSRSARRYAIANGPA